MQRGDKHDRPRQVGPAARAADGTSRSRRTRRRRLNPDSRQSEILRAALTLFADRAADQVSVEEVAAAAGTSPAFVHHYFGSRAELVHFLGCLRAAAVADPRAAQQAERGWRS